MQETTLQGLSPDLGLQVQCGFVVSVVVVFREGKRVLFDLNLGQLPQKHTLRKEESVP